MEDEAPLKEQQWEALKALGILQKSIYSDVHTKTQRFVVQTQG